MSEAAATLKDPVKRRVGLKQVRRALAATEAETLFAARDADQRLLAPLMHMAEEQGVPVAWVDTCLLYTSPRIWFWASIT